MKASTPQNLLNLAKAREAKLKKKQEQLQMKLSEEPELLTPITETKPIESFTPKTEQSIFETVNPVPSYLSQKPLMDVNSTKYWWEDLAKRTAKRKREKEEKKEEERNKRQQNDDQSYSSPTKKIKTDPTPMPVQEIIQNPNPQVVPPAAPSLFSGAASLGLFFVAMVAKNYMARKIHQNIRAPYVRGTAYNPYENL